MADSPTSTPNSQATLGDAINDYLKSLKPDQRRHYERYVRGYVGHMGSDFPVSVLQRREP